MGVLFIMYTHTYTYLHTHTHIHTYIVGMNFIVVVSANEVKSTHTVIFIWRSFNIFPGFAKIRF